MSPLAGRPRRVLFAVLLVSAFWSRSSFTGVVVRTFTTDNLVRVATSEVFRTTTLRTVGVALTVTVVCAALAVPLALYMAKVASPAKMTELEQRGASHGLRFIQLDGNVGVLANGAGLTMTTMDVIDHFGGRPANFLEIGGEAYTKAEVALDLEHGRVSARHRRNRIPQ